MAPIFGMGKLKRTAPNEDTKITTPEPVDPIRRQFLLSGVPEELRKQQSTPCNASAPDSTEHAPFPDVCHIQQTDAQNIWHLSKNNFVCEQYLQRVVEVFT